MEEGVFPRQCLSVTCAAVRKTTSDSIVRNTWKGVSLARVILEAGVSINRAMDTGANAFWDDSVNIVKKVCILIFVFFSLFYP